MKIIDLFYYLYIHIKFILQYNRYLSNKFRIKINYALEMYTVINIPLGDELYGQDLAIQHVKVFAKKIDEFLFEKGVLEFFTLNELEIIDDNNYYIVYTSKLFNNKKIFKKIYLFIILSVLLLFVYIIFNITSNYFNNTLI